MAIFVTELQYTKMIFHYHNTPTHYHKQGTGPVIVMLHGFLESSTMWQKIAAVLSKKNTVLMLDLPGFGQSGVLNKTLTMEAMATIVCEVLAFENFKSATLLGHSMGGYVALAFGELFPKKLDKLILLNSSPTPDSASRKENRDRALIIIDKNKDIKFYNKSAAKLLNFKLPNMIDENLKNAIKDIQKFDAVINFIDESLERKNKSKGISKEIVLDSEEDEKTLILKLSTLRESSGISYILVLEDISTVAKAQRQIAWSEIARRLAHEIKNPLTPIQLSAERVQNKIIDKLNETDKELLNKSTNTIIKQVDALKLMVNEFAEYSRTPSLVRKIINITELIDEISYLYSDQRIEIQKIYPNKIKELKIDENKFRQVLINIFDNSKAATENTKHPKIVITVKCNKNFIMLKFEDNGIGIPKEIMEKIYEPYVTSKKTGTGLGLAIVHKIIEEHSGSIEINNIKPNGVSILITLPFSETKNG